MSEGWINVFDAERVAGQRLGPGTLGYFAGGAGEELTLADNVLIRTTEIYKRDGLQGGHLILLGPGNEEAARQALGVYPGGLQVGGGINANNAKSWLEAGASHIIVTSFVFQRGLLDWERLKGLVDAVGKERLVLDLSCRRRDADYFVACLFVGHGNYINEAARTVLAAIDVAKKLEEDPRAFTRRATISAVGKDGRATLLTDTLMNSLIASAVATGWKR